MPGEARRPVPSDESLSLLPEARRQSNFSIKKIYFKKYFGDWGSWRAVPYKVFCCSLPIAPGARAASVGSSGVSCRAGGGQFSEPRWPQKCFLTAFPEAGGVRSGLGGGGCWGERIAHHPLLPPGTRPSWPGLALGS